MNDAWNKAVEAKLAETLGVLAEQYGVAAGLIKENTEIRDLFVLALKEKWAEDTTGTSQQKFLSKLRETDWWKKNTDEWRKLSVLKHNDPAEYNNRMEAARVKFAASAAKVGVLNVDNQTRDSLIATGIQQGWDEDRFNAALAKYITRDGDNSLAGAAGVLEKELRDLSLRNGVRFSDKFYVSAAQSVIGQQKTADDWQMFIREQSAGMYQAYANQIRSGMDLAEAASGVTAAVAEQLELDPMQVELSDSLVQKALTNVDDAGKPAQLPLWKIKELARQDDRFMKTTRAQREMADIGTEVLKSWGVWK